MFFFLFPALSKNGPICDQNGETTFVHDFFVRLFLYLLSNDGLMTNLNASATAQAGSSWLRWGRGRLVTLRGALGRAGTCLENGRIGVEGELQVWHMSHEHVSVYPTILRLIITCPFDPHFPPTLVRACVGDTVDFTDCVAICCDQKDKGQVCTTQACISFFETLQTAYVDLVMYLTKHFGQFKRDLGTSSL